MTIGRLGCDVAQQVGMRHESRHVPLKTPAQRRIRDDRHRTAEAGKIPGLGGRHQGDGTLGKIRVEAGQRPMFGAGLKE